MKIKGIVLAVILSLASIMMPFSVYADTITSSNINGISVVLDEVTFIENKTWTISGGTLTLPRNYFNYSAEIQFDKSYLGYVDITISYTYFARNDTGVTNFNGTKVQKVFVNGDKAYLAFGFIANSSTDPLTYNSISYTLNSSDLIEYGLISDIETIINILQDNQDIITDIYGELQIVVSNTSLANEYLETLVDMEQYNVPIESFYIVSYALDRLNLYRIQDKYSLTYPIFSIPANTNVMRYSISGSNSYYFILGINAIFNVSDIGNYLTSTNSNIQLVRNRTYGTSYSINNESFRFYLIEIRNNSSSTQNGYIQFAQNKLYVPIYYNVYNNQYLSTDFALNWGLSNSLLDNIQIIANGTQQSNSAASDLESSNDQMADDMDDLSTIESGYNQQFNDQLQSIDFTNPIQNNAGILPAANFVITIFNGLINNNPFSVLIIVVCILLIGKKVIGK